ncbi:MAG TPA: divergent polysaccharide deacetylase family protein, partial [Caulobacteraceae bacterium]
MSPARHTFAKPRPRAQPASLPASPGPALGPFAHPVIGSITAAGFFIACAAALVAMTGNPKAGAPVVRVSLAHIADAAAPPGWRDVLPSEPSGEAPFSAATVALSSTAPEDPGNPNGAAIITISDDASLDGAAAAAGGGLPQAPIAGLFTQGPGGPLPIIGSDGKTVAQAYARPSAPD